MEPPFSSCWQLACCSRRISRKEIIAETSGKLGHFPYLPTSPSCLAEHGNLRRDDDTHLRSKRCGYKFAEAAKNSPPKPKSPSPFPIETKLA
jgi:hypothetical protein